MARNGNGIVRPLFALGVFLAFAAAMSSRDPYAEKEAAVSKPVTVSAPVQTRQPEPAISTPVQFSPPEPSSLTGSWLTLTEDSVAACRDSDTFAELRTLAAKGNEKAFKSRMIKEHKRGNCSIFKSGMSVYVESTDSLSETACIRPLADESGCYHTMMDAIETAIGETDEEKEWTRKMEACGKSKPCLTKLIRERLSGQVDLTVPGADD